MLRILEAVAARYATVWLQFYCERRSRTRECVLVTSARGSRSAGQERSDSAVKLLSELPALAASRMFAAATYFHHVRFLGFLTIFAAVLAALFGRTVACPMPALPGWFFGHDSNLLFGLAIGRAIQ